LNARQMRLIVLCPLEFGEPASFCVVRYAPCLSSFGAPHVAMLWLDVRRSCGTKCQVREVALDAGG
ncbi:MAG TPA: hypothetical protein VHN36_06065, partial [Ilumatobacteraceae bacterium]|nr:hypothetical protein [Ilumatobacteraceae bacterium]